MQTKQFTINTLPAFCAVAADLAGYLPARGIVLLQGDLGAGKTEFARAFIRARCGDPTLEVPSPTFTLLQTYDTPKGPIAHFDLYRLKTPEEIFELGWEDICADALVLVEWPDRLGPYQPASPYTVTIAGPLDNVGTRQITLEEPV